MKQNKTKQTFYKHIYINFISIKKKMDKCIFRNMKIDFIMKNKLIENVNELIFLNDEKTLE